MIRIPSQTPEAASKGDNGELARFRALLACFSRPLREKWCGDTGAPLHLTDLPRRMGDLMPVDSSIVGSRGGILVEG